MPAYLVHAARERARFRHETFTVDSAKGKAMEVLKKCDGVVGLKPGASSIVVFFEPGASIETMCSELEKAFPDLAQPATPPGSAAKAMKDARPKGLVSPNSRRKLELKALLTAGIATVGLVLIGTHRLHAWAGGLFTLLASHHVWERRGRL